MSTLEIQIAARSKRYSEEALTNLHSYINCEMLEQTFADLNKKSASGVDGQTWTDYEERLVESVKQLHSSFKEGSYQAPNIRRVYIPKMDGTKRPLGLPTVEDKLLQTAVTKVLTPIYEQEFYEFSYGFRKGKSPHHAVETIFKEVSFKGMHYVIDADIKNYFGTIDHHQLRNFLDLRIKDGVIRKQIDKWLKAGVLESGQINYPKEGTPQGGTISPLLGNIYLHYVLDDWFKQQIQPLLKGRSCIIRYADDFLLCFANKEDAEKVMKVLPKRVGKYGLTLNEEKTTLVNLKPISNGKPGTFEFLGFTHYMGISRKGKPILKRKTSSKKLNQALKRIYVWIKENRHNSVKWIIHKLNEKLRGHYGYYGITFNSNGIRAFYLQTKRMLYKWIRRRGGKSKWNWQKYSKLIETWIPLDKPKIYHSYF